MENTMAAKNAQVEKHTSFHLKKKAFKVNAILLCVFLCAIHLIIISVDYFEFRTIALFAPYIPFEQTLPFLTLCIKLPHQIARMEEPVNSTQSIDQALILKECKLRNFTSKQVELIKCSDGFETTHSIRKREYSCYAIKTKVIKTYMILEVAAVSRNRAVLYTFILSDHFNQQDELIPLMYFRRRPLNEFHFSRSIQLGEGAKNIFVQLDYELIEIFRLPPPYDTKCIDESVCFDLRGKRYPWCKRPFCVDNVTSTYIKKQEATITGISMEVHSVASPSTRVAYAPEKRPSSFILEIVSLLSLWINFSIYLLSDSLINYISKPKPQPEHSRRTSRMLEPNRRLPTRYHTSSCGANTVQNQETSRREKRAVFLLKFILRATVVILCMREYGIMSIKYLEYKTHVYIHIQAEAMVEYPAVSHCISIYEWFGHKRVSPFYKEYDRLATQYYSGFNYTLKKIFALTPPVESAIDKCQVRFTAETPLMTTSDCNRYFNVSKFFYGVFLCYHFRPEMQFIQPNDFEHNISMIYSIMPSKKLIPKYHHQEIVSYSLPSRSRLLAKEQWGNADNRSNNLAFKTYKYKQLPAPYDTRCGHYDHVTQCENDCMNLTRIGFLSFSHILTKQIDLPVLDYVDLKNVTIASYVQQAQDRCKDACPRPCDDNFVVTSSHSSGSNYTYQITLLSPKYPILFFHAHPVYSLYEYVYQLACSASFWLGLSFVGILRIITSFGSGRANTALTYQNKTPEMIFIRPIKLNNGNRPRKCLISSAACGGTLRIRLKRLMLLFSLTICFCIHTFIMASVYFEYPACMDTRMIYEKNFTQLKTTVCISIDQLDLKGDYSLHNIWAQSPAADEFLVECGHRGPQIPELSHLPDNLRRKIMPFINSSSLCNSLLKIKKFSTLGYICYEVSPGDGMTDAEYRAEYQIRSTRIYEYFIMSSQVSSYNLTVGLSQGSSPNGLFMTTKLPHTSPTSVCVYYQVNNVEYRITSLPHPYDMGVYDSLKRIMCMRTCVGPRVREMKLFSPYDTAHDANYLRHETEVESFQPEAIDIKVECETKCKYERHAQVIHDIYFDTFSDGPHPWKVVKQWNGTITLFVLASNFVVTETTFYPEFRFFDLVIFVGSLFSVWFGQSALQLVDFLVNKIIGGKS